MAEMETHHKADDLTAERAAADALAARLIKCIRLRFRETGKFSEPGGPSELVDIVFDALQTARQGALREAYNIVEDWPLGIEDRLGLLDRLASEGGEHGATRRH